MTPAARLAALAGSWRTLRVIRHADGPVARFTGETVFCRSGDHLRSIEVGMLAQDGGAFEARRETIWATAVDGIDVRFADGRPFHRLDASGHARHDCPPDLYHLRYDFGAWPAWSIRWRVTGPRKDYRALTRYRRP